MTQPPPTRLHVDPPIDQWHVTPRNGRSKPVIATGHQPTLWHPGILAKDLAADTFAKHVGGRALHVVVDYDTVGPPVIDVPTLEGLLLTVKCLRLNKQAEPTGLPANTHAPIDKQYAADVLYDLRDVFYDTQSPLLSVEIGLTDLAAAFEEGEDETNLSEQISGVVQRNALRYAAVPRVLGSGLVTQGFVDRLLADPVGCVRAYNRAALAYPEAGIRPLYLGRDVVEAPLWAQDHGPRTPVFMDLGDSSRPQLFTQGQALDLTGPDVLQHLRPRAVSLSALMRSEHCDLFIHGTGGGVYDRVTEQWWGDWVGESLAPMAVVSADVHMDFGLPTATPGHLTRAIGHAHRLWHNVARFMQRPAPRDAALQQEKRQLLMHMDDDRDKRRRAKAFKRIHQINAELRERHADQIKGAQRDAEDARAGIANASMTRRRDWCFALYPEEQLQDLADQISPRLPASPE